MEVTAQLNNLRIAPRKVRSLAAVLKGLDAVAAKSQLTYTARRSGRPLAKLIDSALANAQNNFGLVKENMYIKRVMVNEGTKLKRFRPKGFGSTSPIEKKTSHIRLVLEERVPGMKTEKKNQPKAGRPRAEAEVGDEVITKHEHEHETKPSEKKSTYQAPPEKDQKKAGVLGGIKRKFFQRKVI